MRLALGAAAAALLIAAPAQATTLRALVVRATWGPPLQPAYQVAEEFRAADAFFRRASFGALGIEADVTPPIPGFVVPSACFAGGGEPGLGALATAAKSAAASLGYDLAAYDRFVYVLPDRVCGAGGLGVVRDVLLAAPGGVSALGVVHELGHTLGLPHASGSACAPRPDDCGRVEYGDPYSPMGVGALDFTAREKVHLGWIPGVPRVAVPGRYRVGTPQDPTGVPHAVVVRTGHGDLWVEDIRTPEPRLVVRLVRARDLPAGPVAHTVYLASGVNAASVPGVLRVRREGAEVELGWLDRTRPSRPRLIGAPRARPGSTTVIVWRAAFDAASGVARYRVRIDGRVVATTEETVATLPRLRRGRHLLTLNTVDRAGNVSRPSRTRLLVR